MKRWGVGLLCGVACVLAQAQIAADVRALLRAAQLTEWLGDSLPMAQSLCVMDKYAANWPMPPSGSRLNEREYERLHQMLERCASSAAGGDPDRGLVSHAKGDFLARVARLSQRSEALKACQLPPDGSADQRQCFQQWAGRALSAAEEKDLRAVLATPTGRSKSH